MTLQTSGIISLGNVDIELRRSGTAAVSLGQGIVRTLAGVQSGIIRLSDLYGKTTFPLAGAVISQQCGLNPNQYNYYATIANGDGTSHDNLITANDYPHCGYIGTASYGFFTPGTYTIPGIPGCSSAQIFLSGGGGGGGGGGCGGQGDRYLGGPGGGGGGGGTGRSLSQLINFPIGTSLQVIVGAGGAGGAGNSTYRRDGTWYFGYPGAPGTDGNVTTILDYQGNLLISAACGAAGLGGGGGGTDTGGEGGGGGSGYPHGSKGNNGFSISNVYPRNGYGGKLNGGLGGNADRGAGANGGLGTNGSAQIVMNRSTSIAGYIYSVPAAVTLTAGNNSGNIGYHNNSWSGSVFGSLTNSTYSSYNVGIPIVSIMDTVQFIPGYADDFGTYPDSYTYSRSLILLGLRAQNAFGNFRLNSLLVEAGSATYTGDTGISTWSWPILANNMMNSSTTYLLEFDI